MYLLLPCVSLAVRKDEANVYHLEQESPVAFIIFRELFVHDLWPWSPGISLPRLVSLLSGFATVLHPSLEWLGKGDNREGRQRVGHRYIILLLGYCRRPKLFRLPAPLALEPILSTGGFRRVVGQ